MGAQLKPFTTDGCSGGMSWAWRKLHGTPPPWEGECVAHDRAYHRGGSRRAKRFVDLRFLAHLKRRITAEYWKRTYHPGPLPWWLREWVLVRRRRGRLVESWPVLALAMFHAVRVGGVPWLPTSWRWGYGHAYLSSFWYVQESA